MILDFPPFTVSVQSLVPVRLRCWTQEWDIPCFRSLKLTLWGSFVDDSLLVSSKCDTKFFLLMTRTTTKVRTYTPASVVVSRLFQKKSNIGSRGTHLTPLPTTTSSIVFTIPVSIQRSNQSSVVSVFLRDWLSLSIV